MPASPKPQAWIDGCVQAHRRLLETIAPLTDAQARRESLLPGWTVGHILTHLARNADGHAGMTAAAQRGQTEFQYPGGTEQRERDIAAGYGRPAGELLADLSGAIQRLEALWAGTSDEVWASGLGRGMSGPVSLALLVFRRWREVEVHLTDLGLQELGTPGWDGLSGAYVDAEWAELTPGLARRAPQGTVLLLAPGDRPSRAFGQGEQMVTVRAPAARILQWLMGRGGEPGWPELGAWG